MSQPDTPRQLSLMSSSFQRLKFEQETTSYHKLSNAFMSIHMSDQPVPELDFEDHFALATLHKCVISTPQMNQNGCCLPVPGE